MFLTNLMIIGCSEPFCRTLSAQNTLPDNSDQSLATTRRIQDRGACAELKSQDKYAWITEEGMVLYGHAM